MRNLALMRCPAEPASAPTALNESLRGAGSNEESAVDGSEGDENNRTVGPLDPIGFVYEQAEGPAVGRPADPR